MAHVEDTDGGAARTPPYIAYQTLKTFFDELEKHGVPSRVDRSVLTRFSGAVGSQLLGALKFLHLIGNDGRPTTALIPVVGDYKTGGAEWATSIKILLEDRYAPIFKMDLKSVTPSEFNEKFREAFPAKENVLRKCITFFLNAARDANIEISPRLLKTSKPRSTTPRPKVPSKPKVNKGKAPAHDESDDGDDNDNLNISSKSAYDVLMQDIYDPTEMEEDSAEEKAVFTLARYLKRKEVK